MIATLDQETTAAVPAQIDGSLTLGPSHRPYLGAIEHLQLKDVDAAELRNHGIPDGYLNSVWLSINFQGEDFTAVVVPKHRDGPYLLVSTPNQDAAAALSTVCGALGRLFNGAPEGPVVKRFEDICEIVKLNSAPTQRSIAETLDGIVEVMGKVTVPFVNYSNVPFAVYRDAGLPLAGMRREA
jgi:hypothetical protein